jgi:hypothetical protein
MQPNTAQLRHLLRLVDDETPEVRHKVTQALAAWGGDLSEDLPQLGIDLSPAERSLVSSLLHPARQARLRAEWLVPTGGWPALAEDWETFEALLRLLSDFLHDGITPRPSLHDALDLLAAECAADHPCPNAEDLRRWLFESGRFTGNHADYHAPQNSDLAWVIANRQSNPLGLALVFILTGKRLDLEIEGCNFPTHFLARIVFHGRTHIVDCYHGGRSHELGSLLDSGSVTRESRAALLAPASPGAMLHRLLLNLRHSFQLAERPADDALIAELVTSLEPGK